MDALDIIDQHLIIRETVGYDVLKDVAIEDMPTVMKFLKIVYSYNRMKRAEKVSPQDNPTIEERLKTVAREWNGGSKSNK